VFRQRSRKARKEATMVKNPVDDKIAQIGKIVEVMLDTWDLPADCNEGELFTYAERLHDRIAAGDSKEPRSRIKPVRARGCGGRILTTFQ
jgi:hypothetical protein